MVVLGSLRREPWIFEAQLGEPLSNSLEGCRHRVRSDRFAGLSLAGEAAAPSEHKEVTEVELLRSEALQVGRCIVPGTKLSPLVPDDTVAFPGFRHDGGGGDIERSADISDEVIAGRRLSMRHGVSCGSACCM
jgi:hypothetical protein